MEKDDSINPRGVSKVAGSAPSGGEGMTILDSVNLFLSLLGGGTSIAGLFGSGGPDFKKLLEKLEFEIKQVFLDDLSDAAVGVAAGVAQAASDFLSADYANAQKNHQTPDELYTMLINNMADRGVGALDAQASTMEQWAQDNPKAIAQKTTSLALTIHSLIVALYREMAANAPDPATKATHEANVRTYAQMAVDRITPLFQSVKESRINGISDIQSGMFRFAQIEFVTDAWFPNSDSPAPRLLMVEFWSNPLFGGGPSPDAGTQIRAAREAYLRLLGSGSDDDAAALKRALGDAFTGVDGESPNAQGVIDKIPSFQTTGRWLAQAPAALQSLRNFAGR